MMDERLPSLIIQWLLISSAVVILVTLTKTYCTKGLSRYPGPLLANFTDAWRFFSVLRGKSQLDLRTLHDKHGQIVRVGPNSLSFSSPEAIKAIYGLNVRLQKVGTCLYPVDHILIDGQSAFYPVQMQISRGVVLQSLFGTQDQNYHTKLRRTVSNAFSMTSLVQYEPRVNDTIRVFLQRTEELYAKKGKPCNFILWLQYFAFDVITEITYSRRVGFIDNCEDVDGIIAWLDRIFDYQAPVSQATLDLSWLY